ncbi:hypothetical protein K505DRAFT_419213 [Melanomma pulvis-pyrius CBS 109.77]|uniref:SET domain-containing protein n=1 Tax=Melanomma pulvis-pyrius CBS 109.77 TaxID=1314802 RepID=A0A6A6X4V1_9PLEO|nr:hypothetical protein K505DRAFT_419213 [Melanomma pulvis-pyrius CBS 109.77]
MSDPMYRIGDSRISGHGLIALSNIQANTVILEEAPLLHINTERASENFDLDAFLADETGQQSTIIQSGMHALNRSNRAAWDHFRNLQSGFRTRARTSVQDIGRVRRNAFSYDFQGQKWITAYHAICKANHSCRPHAVVDIAASGDNRGSARLIATTFIPADTEILIEYVVDDFFLRPTAQRQAELQPQYDFQCACLDCTNPAVSDPIRARMEGYAKDLKFPGLAWDRATETNQFLRAEGLTWQDLLDTAKAYISDLEKFGMIDPRLYGVYAWCARFYYDRGANEHAHRYSSQALGVIAQFFEGADTEGMGNIFAKTSASSMISRYRFNSM